jgi:hypothetical protein
MKRYTPGDLSAVYQRLGPIERTAVDSDVDRLFTLKTGVHRKIEPHRPADKPYIRQWLLVRDAVVAIRRFSQLAAQEKKERGLQAQIETEWHVRQMGTVVEHAAPRAELKGELLGTVLVASHQFVEAVEWSEIFIDVWPHVLEGAAELVEVASPWISVVGLPLGAIANLHEIAEAHELGEARAKREAFMHGWASEVVHGRILNAQPEGTEIGEYQRLGSKAARLYMSQMTAAGRALFLTRYRGPQSYPNENVDLALRDMGYYGRRHR